MKQNHPFHMVTKSPWPILTAINSMTMLIGMTMWTQKKETINLIAGMLFLITCTILWWMDVVRESTFQGLHTKSVKNLMKMGMILFISSEIMFFISFFWTFYHSSLSPSIELGMNWPPKSIKTFNPMEIPLLNTIILLSSGATITWSHMEMINNKMNKSIKAILMTSLLGLIFSTIQLMEYNQASFTMADSIYGSTFFITTGFHGIHVIIGTSFLLVCTMRMKSMNLTKLHHFGFEAAAWYWHFVDIVWLFLYLSIYWWGK